MRSKRLMGILCGINKDGHAEQHEKTTNQMPRRRSGSLQFRQIFDKMTTKLFNFLPEQPRPQDHTRHGAMSQITLDFQHLMMELANPAERSANTKLLEVRHNDSQFYSASQPLEVSGGHRQVPFPEDHFSRNIHIIEKTGLFRAARIAPKGTHLHVHFNSTLLPNFLLDIAKEMPNMYISSPTHTLRSKSDFDNCEIVFTLQDASKVLMGMSEDLELQREELYSVDSKGPNLFHDIYEKGQKMRYQYFRAMWDVERKSRHESQESGVWSMDMECDDWLTSKLIFSKEDVELIFHPKDKLSGTPRQLGAEEEQIRLKKIEEAGWPKDIEVAFHSSPYNDIRKRATRYFERYLALFMQIS